MKIAIFSTQEFEREFFEAANNSFRHELVYFRERLHDQTARLAMGFPAVCAFITDELDAATLATLASGGVRLIALRSAGFNNVDLASATKLSLTVLRVPAYSPHAVAEHAVALMLTLNRNIHRAYNRVREGDFELNGLVGFDMLGKTVGIVGTGKIGAALAQIMAGFGCHLLGFDTYRNPACLALGLEYVDLERLLRDSDIVSLHCPLTPETRHMINGERIALMKRGSMLINTARGALVDTAAAITALKSRNHFSSLGIDVYEEEGPLLFEDLSSSIIEDDVFARLTTFPNVVITGHQGFLTREALTNIAEISLANVTDFEAGKPKPENRVELKS
ncbi:MAG: 2-hydroxyacid dehydrogenase [Hyphomicrobiales bacterium]|nr:2-hydroxyacid dehydrogenase [Hyphomicrobiales bacterium]